MKWPTVDNPAQAVITPTKFDSFGIEWRNFPAMEERGGWSGPYKTVDAARNGAQVWIDYWELTDREVQIVDAQS